MRSIKSKVIIGIIMLLIVAAAILLINFYPMLLMKPTETGKITGTDITAIHTNRNAIYLMEGDDGWIMVDSGTDLNKVKAAFESLDISPDEVSHLLLTHTDLDHVGSAALLTNARIYMSEDEKEMIDGTVKRNSFQYNSLAPEVDMAKVMYLDEDELEIGGISLRSIKTPGHTPGSMTYLLDGKYLFTGDAVRVEANNMELHPYTMDKAKAAESIDKIYDLKDESTLVLTAHYGCFAPEQLLN